MDHFPHSTLVLLVGTSMDPLVPSEDASLRFEVLELDFLLDVLLELFILLFDQFWIVLDDLG